MKKLLSDTVSTGFSQFIATLSQIGLIIYVVRATSKIAFGEFSVALAIEAIIESVVIARTGEVALQLLGKHWVAGEYLVARQIAEKIWKLDLVLNIMIYGCIVILSLLMSGLLNFNYQYVIGIGMMIPAQIGYGVYKSLFIVANKIKEQAIFECCFSISLIFLGIFGVKYYGIPGLIGALVVSAFLKNIIARAVTNRWWPAQAEPEMYAIQETPLTGTENLWGLNVHSVLRNAFMSGANQADVLILNALRGPESVAIYKAAKSLASLPARASAPFWAALRPRILRAWHEGDRNRLIKLITTPSVLMLAFLLVAIVPIRYFAHDSMQIVYGREYLASAMPFLILILGVGIFNAITGWFNFIVIIGDDKTAGTCTYLLLLLLTTFSGILYGAKSNEHMAASVTFSLIVTSVVCWVVLAAKLKGLSAPARPNHVDL